MESEHNFFLCEVCTHPDGSVLKECPSLVGEKKHTDNGPLSQPIRKGDLLFAVRIFFPDPASDSAAGLGYTKSEKVVVVSGSGFRYRIRTGEFVESNPPVQAPAPARRSRRQHTVAPAAEAATAARAYHLQPAAADAIRRSLYAQDRQ